MQNVRAENQAKSKCTKSAQQVQKSPKLHNKYKQTMNKYEMYKY